MGLTIISEDNKCYLFCGLYSSWNEFRELFLENLYKTLKISNPRIILYEKIQEELKCCPEFFKLYMDDIYQKINEQMLAYDYNVLSKEYPGIALFYTTEINPEGDRYWSVESCIKIIKLCEMIKDMDDNEKYEQYVNGLRYCIDKKQFAIHG